MSVKSSNDVYSEIFEKSYSVKSLSNESLSCIDDDEELANELLRKMDAPMVSKLRRCFMRRRRSKSERDHALDLDRKVVDAMRRAAAEEGIDFSECSPVPKHKTWWADEDLFVSSIETIFGHHKYTTHAQKLFKILDPFSTKLIWWEDLLDKLVEYGARKHRSRGEKWKPVEEDDISLVELEHCKKETIIKIVPIGTANTFCYVVISRAGKVGTYDGRLQLLTEYDIFYARSGRHRRMKTTWITDAIYLYDTKSLVMSSSDRSLTIYDASTLTHYPLYLITGIHNIPTCLTYEPSKSKGSESRLWFGDEHGNITSLTFKQPRLCLIYKKHTDRINDYFWIELQSPPHDVYCSTSTWKKQHVRSVRRVFYCERHDVIISCSNDPDASVVIRHRPGKISDYVFGVLRGVTCFHMSSSLRVLATGSSDGCLRLWDPVLTMKPFALMQTRHQKPIVDVAIVAHLELVITCSKNAAIDIWDIYEESCLQTIKIRYPFIGVLGKRVEFGTQCLYPGPKRYSAEEFDLQLSSRCPSNVYMNEDGALKLDNAQSIHTDHYQLESKAESDPEYSFWDKREFLVTCCNHIAVITFNAPPKPEGVTVKAEGLCDDVPSPLPPPDKMTQARRPSIWDTAEFGSSTFPLQNLHPEEARTSKDLTLKVETTPDPQLLAPHTPIISDNATDVPDLDVLLEQAGLHGILKKDFALMMGFKHDLNQKLAELKSKQESMKSPVSQCTPYIALDLYQEDPVKFSRPLPITNRMKRRSGLEVFAEPEAFISHTSCFSMGTPRSSRTSSARASTTSSCQPSTSRHH